MEASYVYMDETYGFNSPFHGLALAADSQAQSSEMACLHKLAASSWHLKGTAWLLIYHRQIDTNEDQE